MEQVAKQDRFFTLRGARLNAGLTLEQAAKKLGITKYILCNYESGRSKVTLAVAWRMKGAYRLRSIEELDPGDNQENQE